MEKNNSWVCVICNKSFSSGKAIGGHMRSHFVMLEIPTKPETNNQALENSTEQTHSAIHSSSPLNFLLDKKTAQSSQSLKHSSFFACLPDSDRENGFLLYPKNPTRKRSKCRRRFIAATEKNAEPKQVSSTCETLLAEEAAWTLIMISKDKWPESKEIKTEKMEEASKTEAKDDCPQARFRCEMCPKVFRSAQGLGGHKAMHRRIQNLCQEGGGSSNILDQNAIKCPYCSKVFKSVQSLGGHKKVHFHNPMAANANTTADEFGDKSLDLNFPALEEDEEVAQIEFSTMTRRE